jgi:hypothetical protein
MLVDFMLVKFFSEVVAIKSKIFKSVSQEFFRLFKRNILVIFQTQLSTVF